MLVLITYDVNTETVAGKARLRKVANNVLIMEDVSRIQFLNASWIVHNVLPLRLLWRILLMKRQIV